MWNVEGLLLSVNLRDYRFIKMHEVSSWCSELTFRLHCMHLYQCLEELDRLQAREKTPRLRALAVLTEDLDRVPSIPLSWPSWEPGIPMLPKHTCEQNIHTHKKWKMEILEGLHQRKPWILCQGKFSHGSRRLLLSKAVPFRLERRLGS